MTAVDPLSALDEALDTMEPQTLPAYPDEPAEAYRVGFGHAIDRVIDLRAALSAVPPEARGRRDVTNLELLHSRLEELADDMDSADPMKGPGLGEFADRLRVAWREGYDTLSAASSSVPAVDPDRLARAMAPTWFEEVDGLTRPATLTDHEWGQMVLNVHIRRADALRRAIEIAAAYNDPALSQPTPPGEPTPPPSVGEG